MAIKERLRIDSVERRGRRGGGETYVSYGTFIGEEQKERKERSMMNTDVQQSIHTAFILHLKPLYQKS